MKKLLIVLLLVFLATATHHYTQAYAGKKNYQPRPGGFYPNCSTGAFSGKAYFNPGVADGDVVGYVNISCTGTSFRLCNGLVGYQLWYEGPAGWVKVDTQCENVSVLCGGNQTYTLTVGGLNYYTSGNYYFEIDAMTGTCSNIGTLLGSWSCYFTI